MSENDKVLETHIEYIRKELTDIKSKLDAQYVTRQEFEPIKRIVYAMVLVTLSGIVAAVIKVLTA